MNNIVLLIIGGIIAIIGRWLNDWWRGKTDLRSAERDNKTLELENSNLRKRLADFLKEKQDRIDQEDYSKNHSRDRKEVDILLMLSTHDGKSLKKISVQVGISEELAIKHIVDLCLDNCVRSPHYMPGSDSWTLAPDMTVWYILQAGRDYLANNPT